ncbi:Zinc finger, PMZ-type [Sesbania bispinosa]|nr:Zinc finger, PMZ-type [Sesbania bispinosa]
MEEEASSSPVHSETVQRSDGLFTDGEPNNNAGLWYATVFDVAHNHDLHDELFTGMLAAHREMGEGDVLEMNAMRSAGIGPSEIYGLFATQSGGYEKIGYRKKDLYNQIGVNHHNKTIVFASAIIANETEDTYVWLLEQFLDAMKGKEPIFVITDGDMAMRNAIRKVFPDSPHRLCVWHLIRNATSNVANTDFTSSFSQCLFNDWDVSKFELFWDDMVEGLGWRIIDGCKMFILKGIPGRLHMRDFIQHFDRLLNYMRHKELEYDFESCNGEHVLQTNFDCLERAGEKQFTKGIFMLFQKVLKKACRYNVIRSRDMASYSVYTVSKSVAHDREWHVSFNPPTVDLSCSCHMVESFGLPCHHIICVLGYLGISDLPKCLVLDRWTRMANQSLRAKYVDAAYFREAHEISERGSLSYHFKELMKEAFYGAEAYRHAKGVVVNEVAYLRSLTAREGRDTVCENKGVGGDVQDPIPARSKGCGPHTTGGTRKSRKRNRCSHCHVTGHNR